MYCTQHARLFIQWATLDDSHQIQHDNTWSGTCLLNHTPFQGAWPRCTPNVPLQRAHGMRNGIKFCVVIKLHRVSKMSAI